MTSSGKNAASPIRRPRRGGKLFWGWVLLLLLSGLSGCGSGDKPQPSVAPPADASNSAEVPPTGLIEAEAKTAHLAAEPLDAKILATQSGACTAAGGGQVQLEDGFAVQIPASGLSGNATLKVTAKEAPSEPNGLLEAFRYYHIELDTPKVVLTKPATLRLPYPPRPAGSTPGTVAVYHLRGNGQIEELSCRPIPGEERVECQVSSFSLLWQVWQNTNWGRSQVADAVIMDHTDRRIIRTTYYSQYDYSWCWAATAAMLFGAQKEQIQPQEVAAAFKAERSSGGSFWPGLITSNSFDLRTLAKGLQMGPVPIKMYALGGIGEKPLRGWLIQQIREGYPVWVGLRKYDDKGGDHAVLVTGYDHVGFYVNDPSGALFAQLEVMAGRAKDKQSAHVDESKLALFRVRYDQWQALMYRSAFQYRPWLTNLGLVQLPATNPRSVSMQIAPASSRTGLSFHRDGFTFANLSESLLYWNGKQPHGAGLSRMEVEPDQPDRAAQMGRGFLCNSDALNRLAITLHNTSTVPFKGSLRVRLDQIVLGGRRPLPANGLQVPLETTQCEVEILDLDRAAQRDPHTPGYVSLEKRAGLDLAAALDFMTNPLPMGRYTLEFELLDERSAVVDHVRVPLEIHPAVVSGVKATARAAQVGGANKNFHEITWEHSPEQARLGGRVEYRVYRIQKTDKDLARPELVVTVKDGSARSASVPVVDGDAVRYSVAVLDPKSGFESPLSQPTALVTGIPEPVANYKWNVAQFAPGKYSIQLQKDRQIWDEPYLLVVEADGQRQYLYPANVKGLSGWNGNLQFVVLPGMKPTRLEFTACFKDGTRRQGASEIKPAAPPPTDPKLEANRTKAQQNFLRALKRGMYLDGSVSKLASDTRTRLAYAEGEEDERSVYRQARDALKSWYAAAKPNEGKGLLYDLNFIQRACLETYYKRHHLDGFLEVIKEREEAKTVQPEEYMQLMEMLVRLRNDTSTAREYWERFQKRVPEWVAGLSAEDLKSRSVQDQKRNCQSWAAKPFGLPVPPIPGPK